MKHLLEHPSEDWKSLLEEWLSSRDTARFRSTQILDHVKGRGVTTPTEMGNLPRELREQLVDGPLGPLGEIDTVQVSTDETRKYRFRCTDGRAIEAVWIPTEDRATLCVSSQAGCPARCSFCATGAGGFHRNLTAAEIVYQFLTVRAERPVNQMVFMGMGEPLLNYDALALALRHLTETFRFSPRRITVSTVGIPDRMEQLAEEFPQVRIALSLHSAVDETRTRIVPVNKRHNLARLRATLRKVSDHARRISLEYVVLKGVNDSPREATALARFASATAGHVNLLPFHPFPGAPHDGLDSREMRRFQRQVEAEYSGRVTIRKSRGLDIAGACGQLANLDGSASTS